MKRNMILAIMITFCFTASLFLIIPIRSANVYDPNADINHNGKVSLSDLSLMAKAYNTGGDPALNVVTTANYSQIADSVILSDDNCAIFQHPTAGFRKVTVCVYAYVFPDTRYDAEQYDIYVGFIIGNGISSYQVDHFTDIAYLPSYLPLMSPENYANCTTRTYDVAGPTIWICIYNYWDYYHDCSPFNATVYIYMTA